MRLLPRMVWRVEDPFPDGIAEPRIPRQLGPWGVPEPVQEECKCLCPEGGEQS